MRRPFEGDWEDRMERELAKEYDAAADAVRSAKMAMLRVRGVVMRGGGVLLCEDSEEFLATLEDMDTRMRHAIAVRR